MPMSGPAVFEYLAEYGAPATRQAVAANPATPARINRLLADDSDEDVRAELAAKIARLMPGLEARESAETVTLTIATLEVLARDSAVQVRAILADEIKHLDCIPRDVALRLARDVEAVVAAPILEYSPLLSDADLIEIIACGQVQQCLDRHRAPPARQRGCQRRPGAVTGRARGGGAAGQSRRPDPQGDPGPHHRAGRRDQSWHLPLVLRADLSARAIRRIGGFVGASLLEQLAARGDLSDATRTHLNRRAAGRGWNSGKTIRRLRRAPPTSSPRRETRGTLDDAFVENAALSGQSRSGHLGAGGAGASARSRRCAKFSHQRSAKPLVALVWRAHLSMRMAFKIQTFVMKLTGRELLPARGGVNFPLSKEEMRWHLAYFDISA